MENAKSLGHNDLVSYMKDNFNKKHVNNSSNTSNY